MVPARGDSRSFPGKNLAPFLGRPLVAHAVATAVAATGVHRVVATTDDDRIASVAAAEGAEVVRRPARLATATSRSVDGVLHALDTLAVPDGAVVVLLQPTSPLRTPADIEECLRLYPGHGSVVQVTAVPGHHPWKACVLQDGLLGPILNILDVRTDKRIDFIGGARGTIALEQAIDSGRAAVAFSLFPVSVSDLMAVSDAGEIMPPKSTWFEPKLRDGLLIHLI